MTPFMSCASRPPRALPLLSPKGGPRRGAPPSLVSPNARASAGGVPPAFATMIGGAAATRGGEPLAQSARRGTSEGGATGRGLASRRAGRRAAASQAVEQHQHARCHSSRPAARALRSLHLARILPFSSSGRRHCQARVLRCATHGSGVGAGGDAWQKPGRNQSTGLAHRALLMTHAPGRALLTGARLLFGVRARLMGRGAAATRCASRPRSRHDTVRLAGRGAGTTRGGLASRGAVRPRADE